MKITDLKKAKTLNNKLTMVTCYDYWTAKIIAKTDLDLILVGDSLAMVMHGHPTTLPATIDLMCLHTQAVSRGAPNKLIIGDMPFLSYRKSLDQSMSAVEKLMQSGCHAIKLEGGKGNEQIIEHIIQSGVSVFGHIGLTPQSIHHLGGHKIQGTHPDQRKALLEEAKLIESLGCSALVLECVPEALAKTITDEISIPTIGIGAGRYVDGQVLVLQDLLGMDPEFAPKFLKTYLKGFELLHDSLNAYHHEVKQGIYPAIEHCYE